METRSSQQSPSSIASRIFQFALSGTQQVHIPPQPTMDSYSRLREQLFPQQMIPARQRHVRQNALNTNLPLPVNSRRNETQRQRSNASTHPSFRSKAVCKLGCSFCQKNICKRGMKAILLADTSVRKCLYRLSFIAPTM
jgi:hypothetical protein